MGILSFSIPPERRRTDMLRQAYLATPEGTPWSARARIANNLLVFEKAANDSAVLHMPWPLDNGPWVTVASSTLMEGPEPYQLPLELARGLLNMVRLTAWGLEDAGIAVPAEAARRMAAATRMFASAVVPIAQPSEGLPSAEQALIEAHAAGEALCEVYRQQLLAVRRRLGSKLQVLLAANLGDWVPSGTVGELLCSAFNAAVIPIPWRLVEPKERGSNWEIPDAQFRWSREQGLAVVAGPIGSFAPEYFPAWLGLYSGDLEGLTEVLCDFTHKVVQRYRGQVQLWQCGGRFNTGDKLLFAEEQRARLIAEVIQTIRELDPGTPLLLCIDQPWGEYLVSREGIYPPIHLADSFVRGGFGLAGVCLEMNLGYYPGTALRPVLEVNRALDRWSFLGLPIFLHITLPSGCGYDQKCQPLGRQPAWGSSPSSQARWVQRLFPVLVAKPGIYGLFWGEPFDFQSHEFPNSGLFDSAGQPKPALRLLRMLREEFLA